MTAHEITDPRLNEIDDCLYRVSARIIIVNDDKVLLVKEIPEMFWSFPGGGVDHGETIETSLPREIEEELGVPADKVSCDFRMVHYTIGSVVNGIPRMNLFYRASIPPVLLRAKTDEVATWGWFTRDEFMSLNMSPSYADKKQFSDVVFGTDDL